MSDTEEITFRFTIDRGNGVHLAILEYDDGRVSHAAVGEHELNGKQNAPLKPEDTYTFDEIGKFAVAVLTNEPGAVTRSNARKMASAIILLNARIETLKQSQTAGYVREA